MASNISNYYCLWNREVGAVSLDGLIIINVIWQESICVLRHLLLAIVLASKEGQAAINKQKSWKGQKYFVERKKIFKNFIKAVKGVKRGRDLPGPLKKVLGLLDFFSPGTTGPSRGPGPVLSRPVLGPSRDFPGLPGTEQSCWTAYCISQDPYLNV